MSINKEIYAKAIDILFRRSSPERLIQRLLNDFRPIDWDFIAMQFLDCAAETLEGASYDEQMLILEELKRICETEKITPLPPYPVLSNFADNVIKWKDGVPVCRCNQALLWRNAYLPVGQDLFICAWLAEQKLEMQDIHFSWPAVISTDDEMLGRLIRDASDNHLHLYAGARIFDLSWASLMNHPSEIVQTDKLNKLLQVHISRGPDTNVWPMSRKMIYAAFLRCKLFQLLEAGSLNIGAELRAFDRAYTSDEIEARKLETELERLRFLYGDTFAHLEQGNVCLDYAFSKKHLSAEKERDFRLLAGERILLYRTFKESASGRLNPFEQWVFYLYLLLKAQLRGELVQVNKQTGFHNFAQYDDRKKTLWKKHEAYKKENLRQSLNASLREYRIAALEGRLCPKNSAAEDMQLIYGIDKAKLFFDQIDDETRNEFRNWNPLLAVSRKGENDNYCFIMHFPKETDECVDSSLKAYPRYRHQKARANYRIQAIALAEALSNSPYLCERIRGIDACAQEIGCRPEVFGPTFRFLRSFKTEWYYRNHYVESRTPNLGITYHAGEDFLELADGLRAIDEAIRFLGMKKGDRLGHALALGIQKNVHYARKGQVAILTKQDLLDNCVWLIFRSKELQIRLPKTLQKSLIQEARSCFSQIYPGVVFRVKEYYHSMLLRGDDPRCYRNQAFQRIVELDYFDRFQINDAVELSQYRKNTIVTKFYFLYHYWLDAKRKGEESVVWTIPPGYQKLLGKMQKAMRKDIHKKGISIECNPSSNVLIGTFGSYQRHPIFCFNNKGIKYKRQGPQMQVSVNSDDPGIFDTSLEFEYALLANVLRENGHTNKEIEKYLRRIVEMGRDQSFMYLP